MGWNAEAGILLAGRNPGMDDARKVALKDNSLKTTA